MNDPDRFDPDSEDILVEQASKGNLNAFNQLVSCYQDFAYNLAYALVGDPDIADDMAQESFIKAYRNINQFRGGCFRSWLLRIVTNACYDLLRRLGGHPEQSLFPLDADGEETETASWLADPAASVEMTVEHNEEVRRVYQIVDELPAVYRSTITLIDFYELDYQEAARILKVPLGTIKSRLARARFKIRERLQEDQENRIQKGKTVRETQAHASQRAGRDFVHSFSGL
jgi:RNA polymerase sigma factor (sigma-70 family)